MIKRNCTTFSLIYCLENQTNSVETRKEDSNGYLVRKIYKGLKKLMLKDEERERERVQGLCWEVGCFCSDLFV